MPELPDVQVFKEYLDATALHQEIAHVAIPGDAVLDDVSARTLRRHLRGRAFTRTRRHGKHLFAACGDGARWLRLHFGMTGDLQYRQGGDPPRHARLVVEFAGGARLAFRDPRKLGRVGLVEDVEAFLGAQGLGPDPLADDLGPRDLLARLDGRRGAIKSALMDQEILAGLGNVYSDETLFRAGVDPRAPIARLSGRHLREIHGAMRWVIDRAIAARVAPERMPRSFLVPRRVAGRPCPRHGCDGAIAQTRVAGRTTYFCPTHQSRAD